MHVLQFKVATPTENTLDLRTEKYMIDKIVKLYKWSVSHSTSEVWFSISIKLDYRNMQEIIDVMMHFSNDADEVMYKLSGDNGPVQFNL